MDILPDASQAPGEEDMLSISCRNKLAAVLQQERTLDAPKLRWATVSFSLKKSCTSPKYSQIEQLFATILKFYFCIFVDFFSKGC